MQCCSTSLLNGRFEQVQKLCSGTCYLSDLSNFVDVEINDSLAVIETPEDKPGMIPFFKARNSIQLVSNADFMSELRSIQPQAEASSNFLVLSSLLIHIDLHWYIDCLAVVVHAESSEQSSEPSSYYRYSERIVMLADHLEDQDRADSELGSVRWRAFACSNEKGTRIALADSVACQAPSWMYDANAAALCLVPTPEKIDKLSSHQKQQACKPLLLL